MLVSGWSIYRFNFFSRRGGRASGPIDLLASNLSRYFLTSFYLMMPISRGANALGGGALSWMLCIFDCDDRCKFSVKDAGHLIIILCFAPDFSRRSQYHVSLSLGPNIKKLLWVGLCFSLYSFLIVAVTIASEGFACPLSMMIPFKDFSSVYLL